jgi:hypothetical protein
MRQNREVANLAKRLRAVTHVPEHLLPLTPVQTEAANQWHTRVDQRVENRFQRCLFRRFGQHQLSEGQVRRRIVTLQAEVTGFQSPTFSRIFVLGPFVGPIHDLHTVDPGR